MTSPPTSPAKAAELAPQSRPLAPGRRSLRWAVLASPIAWALDLVLSYGFIRRMNAHGTRAPHFLVAAAALVVIAVAALRCARASRGSSSDGDPALTTDRTLARWGLALAAFSALLVLGRAATGLVLDPGELTGAPQPERLRVCVAADDLPFSNRAGEGLDNALAAAVAASLGQTVEPVWVMPGPGWMRRTLGAGLCDVLPSVVPGAGPVLSTRAYYRTGHAFVRRREGGPPISSFDDPRLRRWRIGVPLVGDADDVAASPAALALARHGLVDNLRGFPVLGHPPRELAEAFDRGELDAALLVAPVAAYVARVASVPLVWEPAPAHDGDLPLTFEVAMAVRKGDEPRRRALEHALADARPAIEALLARFASPSPTPEKGS